MSVFKCPQRDVYRLEMNYLLYFTDKYRVKAFSTDCLLSNAQCERIGNYCICHCYPEYIMVNGSCLKGNIGRTFETGPYKRLSYCCL